jgi:phosphoribosylpyrophosphate synthetase
MNELERMMCEMDQKGGIEQKGKMDHMDHMDLISGGARTNKEKKHRAKKFLNLSRANNELPLNEPLLDEQPKKKTILLSCVEFNHVVDKIITQDSNCVIQREEKIPINNLEKLHVEDTNFKVIYREKYEKFCTQANLVAYGVESKTKEFHKPSALIYLRKINKLSSDHFYRGFVGWNAYGDLTPDIKMDSSTVRQLRGSRVIFLAYFSFKETVTSIMNQLIFLNSLVHYGVDDLTIVLPFFPVGTMERIVGEGEIPTAYALASILNNIPNGGVKNKLIIFDIHALCSRFFFSGNLRPVLISALPSFVDYIYREFNNDNDNNNNNNIIVFPDDGAKKRFEKILQAIDETHGRTNNPTKTILCSKTRGENGERVIKFESGLENLQNKKNNNLFLIDDLVQSGGTIAETLKGIRAYIQSEMPTIAKSIIYNVMITHSVFPSDEKCKNLFKDENQINKFITTNTLPMRVNALNNMLNGGESTKENEVLKVIEIADILFDVILNEKDTPYIAPYILN